MNIRANEYSSLRRGLSTLPRAAKHEPGAEILLPSVYTPLGHRSALDLARPLVVGNRGAGKSFWAHALQEPSIREHLSEKYRLPQLENMQAVMGFNGSERQDTVAPTPDAIGTALDAGIPPVTIWHTIMLRASLAVHDELAAQVVDLPTRFSDAVKWVQSDVERYQEIMTKVDDRFLALGKKFVIVFDALDRLPGDWIRITDLSRALMRTALSVKSYKAIRLKVFMRPDQYANKDLFRFPDGSKVQNDHVALRWEPTDLYGLLFYELRRSTESNESFVRLMHHLGQRDFMTKETQELLISAMAGQFMGSDHRRGRVYSWVPTHLADGFGDCSPRTFLTAWRVAANSEPPVADRVIDHLGINEGVRSASKDRLQELSEDYWWVKLALEPLRGASVPIDKRVLISTWNTAHTVTRLVNMARETLAPFSFSSETNYINDESNPLLDALETIGVIQTRSNGKINVPDIFRVEAGIKRRGGVAVPKR